MPDVMDRQAVLDRVIAFLHGQGEPAVQRNGCFYRTADGRKSAIGCLIPDELYSEELQGYDPEMLPRYVFDAIDADSDEDFEFLAALETAHDKAARQSRDDGTEFWPLWTTALEPVARGYSLSLAIVQSLGKPTVPKKVTRPPIKLARLGQPPLIWRDR